MSEIRDVALWMEGASPSSIPFPGGRNVYVSKKCADSPVGREWTAVLVMLAAEAWA